MIESLHKPRFPKWLLAVSAVLVLVVIGLSSWFYLAQKASIERAAHDQLNSLANLKVNQIVDWRSQVRSDAGALAYNPTFATLVEEWRKNGTASAEAEHPGLVRRPTRL